MSGNQDGGGDAITNILVNGHSPPSYHCIKSDTKGSEQEAMSDLILLLNICGDCNMSPSQWVVWWWTNVCVLLLDLVLVANNPHSSFQLLLSKHITHSCLRGKCTHCNLLPDWLYVRRANQFYTKCQKVIELHLTSSLGISDTARGPKPCSCA